MPESHKIVKEFVCVLQEALSMQQAALDCARVQEASAQQQLKLLVVHNQQLLRQAADACRGALAGECAVHTSTDLGAAHA